MKKRKSVCILLIFSILLLLLPCTVQAESANAENLDLPANVEYGCSGIDAKVPIMGSQQLISNMESAVLFDVSSNVLLYGLNADKPMYPASLVKIMTTITALELADVSEAVTVRQSVINTVPTNAVVAYLLPNEVLPLGELIYCMMVGSANDAAAVIADHVSGSQEAFVAEMNRIAREIGCIGTNFTNAHGLHDPAQVTTARDVAKIVYYGMQNPLFVEFFSTIYHNVPATNLSEPRYLASNNFLMNTVDDMRLYNDNRVTGGRTGVTEDDRRCIAATAEVKGRQMISVVMGSASKYTDEMYTITFGGFTETTELLNYGFNQYKVVQILYDGQILRQCSVVNGENDIVLGAADSAYAVLPVTVSPSDLSYRYFDNDSGFSAPVEKGEKLSHVQIWYGNVCLTQTDLYAMGAVRTASPTDSHANPQSGNSLWQRILMIVCVIAACIVLAFIVLRIVAKLRLAAVRSRRKRYRKSRRRSR